QSKSPPDNVLQQLQAAGKPKARPTRCAASMEEAETQPVEAVVDEMEIADTDPDYVRQGSQELVPAGVAQFMPTMPLSPGQTPSVAVNVGAGGSVNSVTHPNEYKRLARFMKSQRNTHLVEMGKMWNKSLSDKNKLLKEWISHGENADKIEASLLFKLEHQDREGAEEEQLTVEQMEKIRATVQRQAGTKDEDCPTNPALTRYWVVVKR
ncbi:unnamed protein product, partial [Durusdinium trenchii]